MARHRSWEAYSPTYRAKEVQMISGWLAAGESGSVVGLSGSGRSNLLGFLCHRPDIWQAGLSPQTGPVILIPVDLNDLPADDASTFYRTVLRAFQRAQDQFIAIDQSLPQMVNNLYLKNEAAQDPFLPQSALHELLLRFQEQQVQLVLVLNHFSQFCQSTTPKVINSLRGLRDNFKDTLCYLVGIRQEIAYLPDPTVLGDMYDLLDSHICWVGAMARDDAQQMLTRVLVTAPAPPSETEAKAILALSGGFPTLIKAVAQWWLVDENRAIPSDQWAAALLAEDSIQYRLKRLWDGLTQEEQLALSEVQKLQAQVSRTNIAADYDFSRLSKPLEKAFQALTSQHRSALRQLAAKGLCQPIDQSWWVPGALLAAYVQKAEGRVRGRIWLDPQTQNLYQGSEPIIELTALQSEILRFLVENPRTKHTRDDVIDNAWPEEDQREGITPNALQVHIASIRKKIESNPAQPRYLVTWHGRPGGYQFFPEGKPS